MRSTLSGLFPGVLPFNFFFHQVLEGGSIHQGTVLSIQTEIDALQPAAKRRVLPCDRNVDGRFIEGFKDFQER